MIKPVKAVLLFLFLLNILPGCDFSNLKPRHDYDYIPLDEYKYDHAKIEPGTEVQLLAFSGGNKQNSKENIYYYQFIVLNKATGDTLRILTPLISIDVEAGVDNKTYASPLEYDPSKNVTTAFYEKQDSSQNLLLQVESLADSSPDTSTSLKPLMDKIILKQTVVINKSMPIFENYRYRTAVGILNFKRNPLIR